jgi:aerobic-type carbon monoxide dehydrogenase small subunit (CoxS/CutS family)
MVAEYFLTRFEVFCGVCVIGSVVVMWAFLRQR